MTAKKVVRFILVINSSEVFFCYKKVLCIIVNDMKLFPLQRDFIGVTQKNK